MSRRWLALAFLLNVCFCYGGWLLAQTNRDQPPKPENQTATYLICKSAKNNDLLLNTIHGRTWMLRSSDNGDLTWLPIPRIDSEKESRLLWRKSSDVKSGRSLSIDVLLKEQGYIGISLAKLKAGYLCIDLLVEGKKVFLALDTAAPFTHLDLERVKHLQLKWKPYTKEESKAKGRPTQANSWCEISKIEIGTAEIRHLVVGGHDLSDINNNLLIYTDPQIDGVLGSDVLTKLEAIIDYSAIKIYIKRK